MTRLNLISVPEIGEDGTEMGTLIFADKRPKNGG